MSAADMDGDAIPDLVIPVPRVGLHIYRNRGDGRFDAWAKIAHDPADAAQPHRCSHTIADLDGDGRLDVVYPLEGGDKLLVYFNDGAGQFTTKSAGGTTKAGASSTPVSVTVMREPGAAPLVVVGRDAISGLPAFDSTSCFLDARGVNIECHGPLQDQPALAYHVNGRDIVPDHALVASLGTFTLAFGVSDFDGDGADDAVVGRDFTNQAAIRRRAGGVDDMSSAWGLERYGHGMGVALGDLDGDGKDDAVLSTIGGVLDFKGNGGAFTFRGDASPLMTHTRKIWPWAILAEDLDADGALDLFMVNQLSSSASGDAVEWLIRTGGDDPAPFYTAFIQRSDGSFREDTLPLAAVSVNHRGGLTASLADFDGDGHVDVAMLMPRSLQKEAYDLVIGHPAYAEGNHGLTVRFTHPRPGMKVLTSCDGRTMTRRLYGGEGFINAPRMEAHFGCGKATTHGPIVVSEGSRLVAALPGGATDRAVTVSAP